MIQRKLMPEVLGVLGGDEQNANSHCLTAERSGTVRLLYLVIVRCRRRALQCHLSTVLLCRRPYCHVHACSSASVVCLL